MFPVLTFIHEIQNHEMVRLKWSNRCVWEVLYQLVRILSLLTLGEGGCELCERVYDLMCAYYSICDSGIQLLLLMPRLMLVQSKSSVSSLLHSVR